MLRLTLGLSSPGPEAAVSPSSAEEEPALGAAALLGWGCSGVLSADTDFSPGGPLHRGSRTGGVGRGEGRGQWSRDEGPFWSRPGCGAVASAAQEATGGTREARPPEPSKSPLSTSLVTPCLQNGPLRPAQGAGEKGVQRPGPRAAHRASAERWPLSPAAR